MVMFSFAHLTINGAANDDTNCDGDETETETSRNVKCYDINATFFEIVSEKKKERTNTNEHTVEYLIVV